MDKIAEFKKMVQSSTRIVFFGGAGVSTESGIPDFRSPGGIYDTSAENIRCNRTISTETVRLHRINRKVLLGEDQGKIEAIEGN